MKKNSDKDTFNDDYIKVKDCSYTTENNCGYCNFVIQISTLWNGNDNKYQLIQVDITFTDESTGTYYAIIEMVYAKAD